MYRRAIEPDVREALTDTPAVFLSGPRQSGKTTLAKLIAADHAEARYATLDDLATRRFALDDPHGFAEQAGDSMLVIDEVQIGGENLALAIKKSIDENRRPGRFLLTGSAALYAAPGLANALVGRMQIEHLWPLSLAELGERTTPNAIDALFAGDLPAPAEAPDDLDAVMAAGGFPEAVARSSERGRRQWFDTYIDTSLLRSARELADLAEFTELPRLYGLLAASAGRTLNVSALARDLRISEATTRRYVLLLSASLVVNMVPAWATNTKKRLVKAPKVVHTDTGLLTRALNGAISAHRGELLENWVATELIKSGDSSEIRPRLHHFRTHGGDEVDFVLEARGGGIVGIEVKSAATIGRGDLRGLLALQELAGDRFVQGIVAYRGREAQALARGISAVPAWWL